MNDSSTQTSVLKSPESLRRNRTEPVLSGLVNQIDLNQIARQNQTEPVQTRMGSERQSEPYFNQFKPAQTRTTNQQRPIEAGQFQIGPVQTRLPNQNEAENFVRQNRKEPYQTVMPNPCQRETNNCQQPNRNEPAQTGIPNPYLNEGNNFLQQNRNEPVQSKKNFGFPNVENDNCEDPKVVFNAMEDRY